MKFVKRYRDRLGNDRLYFRKAGHPRNGEALKSPWPDILEGSALEAEVQSIVGTHTTRPRADTLSAAMRAYELSADFSSLGEETRYIYGLFLKELEADFGALHVSNFSPAYILSLRDLWAGRGHRAANMRLQLLKNVLNPVLIAMDAPDPFARIPGVRRPRDLGEPHPIWPEWVVTRVIEEAINLRRFGLARAVALGRYTGARRGDIVRITHAARNSGRIAWTSGKRQVLVNMPEDPTLTDWLSKTPTHQPLSRWQAHAQRKSGVHRLPAKTLIYNISNRPYTPGGLGQEIAQLVGALYVSQAVDSDRYDLHGLRHSFGVEAALAGCSDAQGAALMGHSSPNSFATYRRQASRLRLSDDAATLISALREKDIRTAAEQALSNECLEVSNPPSTVIRFPG